MYFSGTTKYISLPSIGNINKIIFFFQHRNAYLFTIAVMFVFVYLSVLFFVKVMTKQRCSVNHITLTPSHESDSTFINYNGVL